MSPASDIGHTRTPATVVLDGVRVGRGAVLGLRLDPGIHVLWGDPEDGGAELSRVLCGLVAPRRGRVTIAGERPFEDPATRRRIASVLPEEPPLVGKTVAAHFARLHGARLGESLDELSAVAPWLEPLRTRDSASLDDRERRSVAAALLFTTPRPDVAVLYEPEWLAPELDQETLLSRLRELADTGSVVVCFTSDLRTARRLGGQIWSLSGKAPPDEKSACLLLRSDNPRALMARLAGHPAVSALRYADTAPRELWVRGNAPEPLCAAARDAVISEQCELFEMTLVRIQDDFFDNRSDA